MPLCRKLNDLHRGTPPRKPDWNELVEEAIRKAQETGKLSYVLCSNGPIFAMPDSDVSLLLRDYHRVKERGFWGEIGPYPKPTLDDSDYDFQRVAYGVQCSFNQMNGLKYRLLYAAPVDKDIEAWRDLLNAVDPSEYIYFEYAENWACLLESFMSEGQTLTDIAERLSFYCDVGGAYGVKVAVDILYRTWVHGSALRDWYVACYGVDALLNPD